MAGSRVARRARCIALGFVAAALALTSPDASVAAGWVVAQPTASTHGSVSLVAVNDPRVFWSPYNWRADGAVSRTTNEGGAYVDLAFTGSTLGISVDTSELGSTPAGGIAVDAYVDGAAVPIATNLGQAVEGTLTISSTLSSGHHYARVYASQFPGSVDRWTVPQDALVITGFQLASGASLLPLATTPLAPKPQKLIVYGDSITEGVGTTADENSWAAVMASQLGMDDGQVGLAAEGWLLPPGGVPVSFTEPAAPLTATWRNYYANAPRVVDNTNLSSGFIDGSPDLVVNNMGINDANAGVDVTQFRAAIASWLANVRQTVGPQSRIAMVVPWNYGLGAAYDSYKSAYLGGIADYEAAAPEDAGVFVVDLGATAADVVAHNSIDGLHPNNAGAATLGKLTAGAIAPVLGDGPAVGQPGTPGTITPSSANGQEQLSWTPPASAGSAPITDYVVNYRAVGSKAWQIFNDGVSTAPTATVTGLKNGTAYQFTVAATNRIGTGPPSPTATDVPGAQVFGDTFDSDATGALSGQHGWNAVGGSWTVGPNPTGAGQIVTGSGAGQFTSQQIANTGQGDVSRVVFDSDYPAPNGNGDVYAMGLLRKPSAASGDGFAAYSEINKEIAVTVKGAAQHYYGPTPIAISPNTWYTYDLTTYDNAAGSPTLQFFIYPQGTSRAQSIDTGTIVDTRGAFQNPSRFFALATNDGNTTYYDNVKAYN